MVLLLIVRLTKLYRLCRESQNALFGSTYLCLFSLSFTKEYENREKDSNRTDKLHRELADKHELVTILQARVQELTATVDHLSNIQMKTDSERDRQLLDAVSQMQQQQEQVKLLIFCTRPILTGEITRATRDD